MPKQNRRLLQSKRLVFTGDALDPSASIVEGGVSLVRLSEFKRFIRIVVQRYFDNRPYEAKLSDTLCEGTFQQLNLE